MGPVMAVAGPATRSARFALLAFALLALVFVDAEFPPFAAGFDGVFDEGLWALDMRISKWSAHCTIAGMPHPLVLALEATRPWPRGAARGLVALRKDLESFVGVGEDRVRVLLRVAELSLATGAVEEAI